MTISELNLKVLSDSKFCLTTDVRYEFDDKIITIHKGFIWDGASIPRELWSVVGCPCSHLAESCLHDALYASCIYNRKDSDKMFHSALIANGNDYFTAKTLYLGVRVGGELFYGKKSKSEAREFVSVEFK